MFMGQSVAVKAFAIVSTAVLMSGAAQSSPLDAFSSLVVFGDSYSDGGNAFVATGGQRPDPTKYPDHQFTNGDVWATQLGAVASLAGGLNFAFGGAEALLDGDEIPPIPDFASQIAMFEASLGNNLISVGPRPLIGVFIGGNDLREATNTGNTAGVVTQTVGAIDTGLRRLIQNPNFTNLKEFAIFGMPNLGRLPENVGTTKASDATDLSIDYNDQLTDVIDALPKEATVRFIDTFSLFENVFENAGTLGFTVATSPCLEEEEVAVCWGNSGYAFIDEVHATEPVQTIMADAFLTAIEAPAVPLPAAGWLILGGLGALGGLRLRQRMH